jgi:hypothetical protein
LSDCRRAFGVLREQASGLHLEWIHSSNTLEHVHPAYFPIFEIDALNEAAAVAKAGAAALVLVSPLPGEPAIHEINRGKLSVLLEWGV